MALVEWVLGGPALDPQVPSGGPKRGCLCYYHYIYISTPRSIFKPISSTFPRTPPKALSVDGWNTQHCDRRTPTMCRMWKVLVVECECGERHEAPLGARWACARCHRQYQPEVDDRTRCIFVRSDGQRCNDTDLYRFSQPLCTIHWQRMYGQFQKFFIAEAQTSREYERLKDLERGEAEYEASLAKIAAEEVLFTPRRPAGDCGTNMVYFLQATATGRIKIGTTTDLRLRMQALRCQVGQLEILATQAGGNELEKALHRRFADDRRHGEWFEPTEALLSHIATVRQAQSTEGDT